jgi:hypothetical protein
MAMRYWHKRNFRSALLEIFRSGKIRRTYWRTLDINQEVT